MSKTNLHHALTLDVVSLSPGLYMVATPIGNLKDITLRALEVLHAVDVIYCEDTRVSNKLLSAYTIKAKLYVYNDHSTEADRKRIIETIQSGQSVALISDAGTPLVSDPGHKLLREVVEAGLHVTTLPGPSALTAAISLCGLPTDKILFGGFLPPKSAQRKKAIVSLLRKEVTFIGYERASRVKELLADIDEKFPIAHIAIMRELTKRYEEIIRGRVRELLMDSRIETLKGEVVYALKIEQADTSEDDIHQKLRNYLQKHRVKDAVNMLAAETGKNKRELYQLALELQQEDDES